MNTRFFAILLLYISINVCQAGDTYKIQRWEVKKGTTRQIACPAANNLNENVKFARERPIDKLPSVKNKNLSIIKPVGTSLLSQKLEVTKSRVLTTESMIEIGGDVTSELRLVSGNTYHAVSNVNVLSGGVLIQEPGVVIYWAEGTGLYVEQGGTIIMRGVPENICANTADIEDAPFGYWQGIVFDSNCSPNSEISFCYIGFAETGIEEHNLCLIRPYRHNFLDNCVWGIKTYGPKHTSIENNIFYYNGTEYWDGYGWVPIGAGIEGYHASYEGLEDANSVIQITQNTCYDNETGIKVHGVSDPDNSGVTMLINNASCASVIYNYELVDGYMTGVIQNNGRWLYYYGSENKNWDFPEDNPVETFSNPFVQGPEYMDLVYLNQSCLFINAGDTLTAATPYVGTTTSLTWMPDGNEIDIGFHYTNWSFSNAGSTNLSADFNHDLKVDFADLGFLCEYWLYDYEAAYQTWRRDFDDNGIVCFEDLKVIADNWLLPYDMYTFSWFAGEWLNRWDDRLFERSPDLNSDNLVNFSDFAAMALEWLKTGDADPNIQITVDGDGSNGYVDVGISGTSPDTVGVSLFMDGHYIEDMWGFNDGEKTWLDVSRWPTGPHQLKVVSQNAAGKITCSHIKEVNFTPSLDYCMVLEEYEKGKPLYFCASSPSSSVTVKAKTGDTVVWSQTYTAGHVVGAVPANIAATNEIDYVDFELAGTFTSSMDGLQKASSTTSSTISKSSSVLFNPKNVPAGVRALILLPNIVVNTANTATIAKVKETFENHSVPYYTLKWWQASYVNTAWFGIYCNIEYLYFTGHGAYQDNGKFRTMVSLNGVCPSVTKSNFPSGGGPEWLEETLDNYETPETFFSMWFTTLKLVHLDCCYSGRLTINEENELDEGSKEQQGVLDIPHSDMTWALRLGYNDTSGFLLGWYDWFKHGAVSEYSRFNRNIWVRLDEGYDLYQAILYAIYRCNSTEVRDEFRIRGSGWLQEVTIE